MPLTAAFRTTANPTSDRIDRENGIIYGCQIVKAGATARFAGQDGKPDEIDVTPKLIKRLADLAHGRSLNAHWTHDWLHEDVKDPLNSKIGGWKNVRVDEATGNLIGDLHLMPSEFREATLWLAENTPDGAMMSIVFAFERENERHANPLRFDGIDLVEVGAASDAFFSAVIPTKNKPMTKEELIALFADPEVKQAAQAAFAKADDDGAKEKAELAAAAALEKEAGVTDEDKKPEDEGKPAMLRAQLRASRANKRLVAAMAGEAAVKAEAAVVGKIGNNKIITDLNKGGDKVETFEQAKQAALAAGCKSEAAAIRFVAANKPELYNAHMKGVK